MAIYFCLPQEDTFLFLKEETSYYLSKIFNVEILETTDYKKAQLVF